MEKEDPNKARQNPQDLDRFKNTRSQISGALGESGNKQYMDYVEEYSSLLNRLRNAAEERNVGVPLKVYIELDNGENANKSEIEKAMLQAFRNLPAMFEECGESLAGMPDNSIRGNIENLEELEITLKRLEEFFYDLKEQLKTNNAELISVIDNAQNTVEELINRVTRVIYAMEELLWRSLNG